MKITPEQILRRQEIGRRLIYALVAIAVITPYVCDVPFLRFKFEPSPPARALYDKIESLKPGTAVLLCPDYDPASAPELQPMAVAIMRHCFRRDLHPIVMTFGVAGLNMFKELCETTSAEAGKRSGKDFVFLGFRPGGIAVILGMGESIQRTFTKDFYGQPTEGMPALAGVRSLKEKSIGLAINFATSASIDGTWIPYVRDRYGIDLGGGCTAVMAPDLYPYLQSGQLVGLLGGLRGAADYETLVNAPDMATKGMQAQSAVHVLLITLIIGANVAYVFRKFSGPKEA
jgi:hypothetical protein